MNRYIIDYGMGYFHPKLGDAIVYYSAFCHFKRVTWRQKQKAPITDVWKKLQPMYAGRYDLKIQHGKPTYSDRNFMNEMWKVGMKIAPPMFNDLDVSEFNLPERYATIQNIAAYEGRNVDATEYADGLPLVNLDEITKTRDKDDVRRLMTIQKNAELHVGADSGCAWSAIAVGTPVRVLEADRGTLDPLRWGMHQCALKLMLNNNHVEIIRRT